MSKTENKKIELTYSNLATGTVLALAGTGVIFLGIAWVVGLVYFLSTKGL